MAVVAPPSELVNPVDSARAAGLHYVSDLSPGLRRKRAGNGFAYLSPDGSPVHDPDTIRRIKQLVIPPAWTDVWISPDPQGHLQATGRDARGRKQYRYHARWREVRNAVKYDRMLAFAEALPRIREQTDRDLERPGMPRAKVLAAVVRLLEETRIRVGNDEYRKQNGSFGLTTLRDRQVSVVGSEVRFSFRGKSGKYHRVELDDRRLARIIRRIQEIPGQELFQYVGADDEIRPIESADVNNYLRDISGEDFTAKDFRTWAGTVLAARYLSEAITAPNTRGAKRAVVRAIGRVADELGNTPAVSKAYYIHPAVITAYLAGALKPVKEKDDGNPYRLSAEEREVLALLGAQAAPPPTARSKRGNRRSKRAPRT